jgi:hypothetical protein
MKVESSDQHFNGGRIRQNYFDRVDMLRWAWGRRTMNKGVAIASLLLGVAGFAAPVRAAQQESSQGIKQSVTKKARAIAAHAGVKYMGPPRFVPIEETSISYATNTPQEVINFGNSFYLSAEQIWLMSPNAQGPWRAAPYVPKVVSAIICSQLNAYPLNPYQLCALPWSSGLSYAAWRPS